MPARGPNRTTADELGLTIPAQLYIFAGEVIEEKVKSAAPRMSPFGTKQTYTDVWRFVRFWSKADMYRRMDAIICAAFDPKRT